MPRERPEGLVPVQCLTPQERDEVEALRGICRQHEELELPLPGNEVNQFLYYAEGSLIGFVSLPVEEPEGSIELLGMVHPGYRRRGIGRTLLDAARTECRQRGIPTFLVVCEDSSRSGVAFTQTVGGQYRFSEYRMELDPTSTRNVPPGREEILLERAGPNDAEALARLQAASMDRWLEETRRRVAHWFASPDQRFYVGMRQGEPVGSLRVFQIEEESTVYLHTFGVLPEYRGRGYGRQILGKVIDDLLAECWGHVRIEVDVENAVALALYRTSGFREIAAYHYYELNA
jgi:ribosomal protein S18 acetylase RimI-like enzyme